MSIEEATPKDRQDILEVLLPKWIDDSLDKNLKQRTLVSLDKKDTPNRDGWRIDSQSNGPFVKFPKEDPDTKYQNLAVQNQDKKGKQVVYSGLIAPVGVKLGKQMFKDGFIKSMDNKKVVVIKRVNTTSPWQMVLE